MFGGGLPIWVRSGDLGFDVPNALPPELSSAETVGTFFTLLEWENRVVLKGNVIFAGFRSDRENNKRIGFRRVYSLIMRD